jgi:hypothetical protein
MNAEVGGHFVGQWIGDLRGSIIGNLYVEFKPIDRSIVMNVHANSGGNATVLAGPIDASTSPPSAVLSVLPAGTTAATAMVTGGQTEALTTFQFDTVTAERISGRWTSNDGNAGVFQLSPARTSHSDVSAQQGPTEIVSRTYELPKLTLYRSDLVDIALKLKEVIQTPNDVVISARIDGVDTVTFARSFFQKPNLPNELGSIRLSLTETKPFAPKSISLSFSNDITPSLTINSDDRVWVNGVFADLDKYMRRYYTWFLDKFQKHALNLNGIALLIAIGALPNLPGSLSRYVFLAIVVSLIVGFKAFHDYINRVRIFPRKERKDRRFLDMPEIISAAATAGLVGVAGYLVSFFSADGLTKVGAWISGFLTP